MNERQKRYWKTVTTAPIKLTVEFPVNAISKQAEDKIIDITGGFVQCIFNGLVMGNKEEREYMIDIINAMTKINEAIINRSNKAINFNK